MSLEPPSDLNPPENCSSPSDSSAEDEPSSSPRKRVNRRVVASFVKPGERAHPQSAYYGSPTHERVQTAKSEREVLKQYLAEEGLENASDMSEEEYISYILDDFVIYRTPDIKTISEESLEGNIPFREREAKGQGEFELPSAVYVKAGVKNLVFDGVLKSRGKEEVLHCVPFDKLSIGNLVTPTEHNLNNSIWIQSLRGAKMVGPNDVWYELGSPAAEYAKHWEAFMWLAYLVKYVSDALQVCIDRQQKVTLNYFQKTFADDMRQLHSDDIQFQKWLTLYGKDDFRAAMAAHALFLWQQLGTAANSHSGLTKHLKQPIWGEILYTDLSAIHPAHAPQRSRDRCAVTAYVANLWEWIFSEGIQTIGPDDFDKMDKHDDIEEDDDIDIEDFLISKPKEPVGPKYYNFLHDEYGKAVYDRYTTHSTGPVVVGDVVELSRDSNSRWTKSTQKWYAFVTDRWTTPKGAERIKIIWLYWPEDVALCMSMKYPYSNELFFSDHCECDKTISLDEVVRKVAVEFFCIDGKPENKAAEFFIRQKYFSIEHDIHISTLSPDDLSPSTPCPCRPNRTLPTFIPGDFVLVQEHSRLQPFRFEGYDENRAWVRILERRREVEGTGKINELRWTNELVDVSVKRLVRKCFVVRVDGEGEIPALADWGGACDVFFYRVASKNEDTKMVNGRKIDVDDSQTETTQEEALVETSVLNTPIVPLVEMTREITSASLVLENVEGSSLRATPAVMALPEDSGSTEAISTEVVETGCVSAKPVSRESVPLDSVSAEPPPPAEIKFEDIPEDRKLRGLDLFCGGGNFGRGVAGGGAVHHKWAVDIDINAMHTYKANLEESDVNLYLGSINNFLFDVITGRQRKLPKRGDIDFIVAGSPCQGFSNANPKGHEALKSLSNSALVCTTLAAIDYYRPKYAILENVPAMAADRKYRGQNVNISNQIMCTLIGMGYQCRCLLLDAWHFGAPQSRTRLFIEIAAPGCALPEIPPGSHAHHPDMRGRAVGRTAANIRFAERDLDTLTAFPAVKLKDSWDDLPNIGNGHLGLCIPHPDHRLHRLANNRDRHLVAHIPESDPLGTGSARNPGYIYAIERGLIPPHLRLGAPRFQGKDLKFTRLSKDGLCPTVTCVITPISAVGGKVMHYTENRMMSNMEARRAQGFLDSDVLVGSAAKAFRIIGNSVCRQVAFALGGKLAEAVKKGPVGSGNGKVVEEISLRREIEVESRIPPRHKVMVLITQKKRKDTPEDSTMRDDNVVRDIPSEDVGVDSMVGKGSDRVEVLVISSPRKRIRIEVDEEM